MSATDTARVALLGAPDAELRAIGGLVRVSAPVALAQAAEKIGRRLWENREPPLSPDVRVHLWSILRAIAEAGVYDVGEADGAGAQ